MIEKLSMFLTKNEKCDSIFSGNQLLEKVSDRFF